MENYSENPTIRGIVEVAKAIPIAGSFVSIFDAAAMTAIERYREAQLAIFLDELANSGLDPNAPIPEGKQYDIIRAILITSEAVARSHREEKARAFARLLAAGIQEPIRISLSDEFEDYVSILDDVSWRELQMMALLAKFEEPYRNTSISLQEREIRAYWPDFLRSMTTQLDIPTPGTSGLLARLSRTGLYEIRLVPLAGNTQIIGALTGTYHRLAELLRSHVQ
jgi:hypothetical protein